MAKNDVRNKTLHYRYAITLPDHSLFETKDLQFRLKDQLASNYVSVKDRLLFTDLPSGLGTPTVARHAHMAISKWFEQGGMLFAEIVYIEPGNSVPVFPISDYDKDQLSYAALNISSNKVNEYLDSIAYIGIVKNHLVILQSRSIRMKDIENYLNFILESDICKGRNNYLVVQANNLTISNDLLKRNEVKNVSLNLPVTYNGTYLDANAADLLMSLIGEQRVAEIKEKSLQHLDSKKDSLNINISIGYKYKATLDELELLKRITEGLVDNRDESLTIELKGAGILRNDEIQVKDSFNIAYSNGLPVKEKVADEMINWLLSLLNKGVINP